jgi:tRNA-Thr(GGU) m(6)t(6)A37 methyltransferase TsaA
VPVVHGAIPVPALNDGAGGPPVPDPLAMVAIGVVRSPCRDRHAMPGEGVAARIEVHPEHAGELAGIEHTSHLVVLGWLHEAHVPLVGEVRRRELPGLSDRGAFATRSPRRPNPISLSVVRLVARHGNTLEVEGLDLIDGTIILDLKPYLPGLDGVFGAVRAWRSRTNRGRERLAGYLDQEVRNHMGSLADEPEARLAIEAVLLAAERLGVDPRNPALSATVNRAGATADVLMALLGATLASGRVAITRTRGPLRVRFTLGGRSLEVCRERPRGRAGPGKARSGKASTGTTSHGGWVEQPG